MILDGVGMHFFACVFNMLVLLDATSIFGCVCQMLVSGMIALLDALVGSFCNRSACIPFYSFSLSHFLRFARCLGRIILHCVFFSFFLSLVPGLANHFVICVPFFLAICVCML